VNDSGNTQSIPAHAGIGLRPPHMEQVINSLPPVAWFEVHSENYFKPGGEMLRQIATVREHYPISLHGVGLSLGTADRHYQQHLLSLKQLVAAIQQGLISEHISWGRGGQFYCRSPTPKNRWI